MRNNKKFIEKHTYEVGKRLNGEQFPNLRGNRRKKHDDLTERFEALAVGDWFPIPIKGPDPRRYANTLRQWFYTSYPKQAQIAFEFDKQRLCVLRKKAA